MVPLGMELVLGGPYACTERVAGKGKGATVERMQRKRRQRHRRYHREPEKETTAGLANHSALPRLEVCPAEFD